MGLTGKKGRELSQHTLDTILRNTRWRYRGLLYVNLANKDVNPEELRVCKLGGVRGAS